MLISREEEEEEEEELVVVVLVMLMSRHHRYREILEISTGKVINRVDMVEVGMGRVSNHIHSRNRSRRRSRIC